MIRRPCLLLEGWAAAVPEVDRQDVRERLLGGYRVVYRVGVEELMVLTVRHGRRLIDPAELRP